MVQEKRMNGQTMRKQMRKEAPDVDQFHILRLFYQIFRFHPFDMFCGWISICGLSLYSLSMP